MKKSVVVLVSLMLLAGCQKSETDQTSEEPLVRGLRTVVVKDQEQTTVRRYPSVLQPSEITTLSFETPGRIGAMNLKVGQRLAKGDKIAELDSKSLTIQVGNAQAGVELALSNAKNAEDEYSRQKTLFDKKIITTAKLDKSRTSMETTKAQLAQANKQLDAANENLEKAVLHAPFGGIVNSIEIESYSNVGAGTPVVTIYGTDGFESAFSVNYEVIKQIGVGKKVQIRLADNSAVSLGGTVNELGSRADAVSSFPLVVKLDEQHPELKAGMAVEVSIELAVANGKGFVLPLTVLALNSDLIAQKNSNQPGGAKVFVFDQATSTVQTRQVMIDGIRENNLIVVSGIKVGERIASAGVSFLREGQRVKLLSDEQ